MAKPGQNHLLYRTESVFILDGILEEQDGRGRFRLAEWKGRLAGGRGVILPRYLRMPPSRSMAGQTLSRGTVEA